MFWGTASFSSFWGLLPISVEAVGALWLIVTAVEILTWVALWRAGFRFRRIPDFLLAALAKVRGLLRLDRHSLTFRD